MSSRTINIDTHHAVWALVFLEDGRHLLSGGENGLIRKWDITGGKEVDRALRASGTVRSIALSGDQKWIIAGDDTAVATIWDRNTLQVAHTVSEHEEALLTLDVSPDSTQFATGSKDGRASVWHMLTGLRLVGPLYHDFGVVSVRFSPSGDRIATATWERESLRVYDAYNGEMLSNIPIVSYARNSIAWSGDSQYIYALSSDTMRKIHVHTESFASEWTVPSASGNNPGSMVLSSNGKFIVITVGSILSFWDICEVHRRFGSAYDHAGVLRAIALSPNNAYVATGSETGTITIRHLDDIVPTSHLHGKGQVRAAPGDNAGLQRQIDALRKSYHALELRVDELTKQKIKPADPPRAQAQIQNGIYRIRNQKLSVYLTCPQDVFGTDHSVLVKPLDAFSDHDAQLWSVSSLGNGGYSVVGRVGNLDAPLNVGNGHSIVCVPNATPTSWVFESAKGVYLIGLAENPKVVHIAKSGQSVFMMRRNNKTRQYWTLEPVVEALPLPSA